MVKWSGLQGGGKEQEYAQALEAAVGMIYETNGKQIMGLLLHNILRSLGALSTEV